MKIKYLDCDGRAKLFSFHRHAYREITIDDKFYMIDGGFDYIRSSVNGEIKEDEISNLISDIRKSFTWGQNYDKNHKRLSKTIYKKLKDLDTDHIINILKYFTEDLVFSIHKQKELEINDYTNVNESWCVTHLIFLEELIYRSKNNIL